MKTNKEHILKQVLSDRSQWVRTNEEIATYVGCTPVYVAMIRRKMVRHNEVPLECVTKNKESRIRTELLRESLSCSTLEDVSEKVGCTSVYVSMIRRKMVREGVLPPNKKPLKELQEGAEFVSEEGFEEHFCQKFASTSRQGRTLSGRYDVLTNDTVWELKLNILKLREAIAAYAQAMEYKEHLGVERVGVASYRMSVECEEWLKKNDCEVYYEISI